jgi:hypothetical protein
MKLLTYELSNFSEVCNKSDALEFAKAFALEFQTTTYCDMNIDEALESFMRS